MFVVNHNGETTHWEDAVIEALATKPKNKKNIAKKFAHKVNWNDVRNGCTAAYFGLMAVTVLKGMKDK